MNKVKMPRPMWWCCGCKKYHSGDEAQHFSASGLAYCWRAYYKLPPSEIVVSAYTKSEKGAMR